MRSARTLSACAIALAMAAPGTAFARDKVAPEQVAAWAACAAEKNAGEVAWMYIIQSNQSGLQGAVLDGAFGNAVGGMMRDCVPEGTALDGDQIDELSQKAFALWRGDVGKASMRREVDAWVDCMAENYPAKGRAYLYATDFAFAGGPRLIVQDVDPVEAIFEPTAECEALKPADPRGANQTHLYARLNYLLRVKPRLPAAPSATVEDEH